MLTELALLPRTSCSSSRTLLLSRSFSFFTSSNSCRWNATSSSRGVVGTTPELPTPLVTDVDDDRPGWFRADVFDELRFRRDAVGCVGPLLRGSPCAPPSDGSSSRFGAVEVDDVVDATEAECARRADNSRVSRLTCAPGQQSTCRDPPGQKPTTASCSFSNSRYNSAAVIGRGCRTGSCAAALLDAAGLRGGNGT